MRCKILAGPWLHCSAIADTLQISAEERKHWCVRVWGGDKQLVLARMQALRY